jgi:hypothetical protein
MLGGHRLQQEASNAQLCCQIGRQRISVSDAQQGALHASCRLQHRHNLLLHTNPCCGLPKALAAICVTRISVSDTLHPRACWAQSGNMPAADCDTGTTCCCHMCTPAPAAAAASVAALLHSEDGLEDLTHAVTVVNICHGVLPQAVTQAQGDDPAHQDSNQPQGRYRQWSATQCVVGSDSRQLRFSCLGQQAAWVMRRSHHPGHRCQHTKMVSRDRGRLIHQRIQATSARVAYL